VPRKTTFGTYLRKARQKQKLRVRDVAAKMDVSDAAITGGKLTTDVQRTRI
jgi:putative heme degradation protein